MRLKKIKINNFKSIRELAFEARRVNVFIGEPNTGKTNVIEALSLFSENAFEEGVLRRLARFQHPSDLFFDNDITQPIQVIADGLSFKLGISEGQTHATGFHCTLNVAGKDSRRIEFYLHADGKLQATIRNLDASDFKNGIRRYIFTTLERFQPLILTYLNPPSGNNLPQLIYNIPHLYDTISNILGERGFKLLVRPVENEIHLAKEVKGKLSSYPYQTISETWKRIMFLLAVLETNHDQVLLLDEPEANIFPFFNSQVAETIGAYNTNQFFITTHNPYFLQSLIEKTPREDLAIFVARMEHFETKMEQLDPEQISEMIDLGASVFSNLGDLTAPA